MVYVRENQGVCSARTEVSLHGDVIEEIKVVGGCNGNLQGVSALLKGMRVQDAIDRLSGIRCGFRTTSCPDQIAKALQEAMRQEQ